jgi:hypothetical protein
MEQSGTSIDERPPRWQLWLAVLAGVGVFLFGAVGYWRYESRLHPGAYPDLLSVLYHTAQLLVLHAPHLTHDVPWELHVARLLGVAFVFAAGLLAAWKLFRQEWLTFRLWLPWRRDHVVICGLGDLGLRLAIEGRRKGKFIVAIENQGNRSAPDQARANGVLVIEGDACDLPVLRRARVGRAEFVVAACPEDHTNVAIAAQARTLALQGGRA